MCVQDGAGFWVSSPAPWWPGPAAPPVGTQPKEAKQSPGTLLTSPAFRCFGSALSPAHLPPASCRLCLPSVTCARRSPNFHPAPSWSPPPRGRALLRGHAVPRFLPVLGRSSGARQDPACPCSRSDPGRQAPLNAGAISMSPHGDTARKDGRAGAGWADSKQVAALEGGQHITTRAQNDPNTRLHPSQGSWLPLAKDSPWRGRENGGDHPQACSEL